MMMAEQHKIFSRRFVIGYLVSRLEIRECEFFPGKKIIRYDKQLSYHLSKLSTLVDQFQR